MKNDEIIQSGQAQAASEIKYIMDWCKDRGVSQKALCEMAGASMAVLSHWGRETPRTLDIFFSLHKAMDAIDANRESNQ